MPQSLASVYLHAVFSTKQRQPFLINPGFRREVHAYIAGITKRLECPSIEIGGTEDHVHALIRFGRTITIAEWVRQTKQVSSTFAKSKIPAFSWQNGYGAFGVPFDRLDTVRAYIRNQEEHHRRETFQEEFLRLLEQHGEEWDERYVWD